MTVGRALIDSSLSKVTVGSKILCGFLLSQDLPPGLLLLRNVRSDRLQGTNGNDRMKTVKRQIIQLLNRTLVANVTLMRFVQAACLLVGVAVLTVGVWRLTYSDLTAFQAIVGVLFSSLISLAFIGVGLLLPSFATLGDEQ